MWAVTWRNSPFACEKLRAHVWLCSLISWVVIVQPALHCDWFTEQYTPHSLLKIKIKLEITSNRGILQKDTQPISCSQTFPFIGLVIVSPSGVLFFLKNLSWCNPFISTCNQLCVLTGSAAFRRATGDCEPRGLSGNHREVHLSTQIQKGENTFTYKHQCFAEVVK